MVGNDEEIVQLGKNVVGVDGCGVEGASGGAIGDVGAGGKGPGDDVIVVVCEMLMEMAIAMMKMLLHHVIPLPGCEDIFLFP